MRPGPIRPPAAKTVAAAAFVVGAALRIEQFLGRPSLWLDEAMLATNITGRSFGELLDPLANTQGAPVLFLWVQRLAVVVLGDNEYALRLVPLLAGIAVLPLVHLAARRLLGPRVALAALVLAALSPALVRYSTEVKQYSTDAAIAVAILLLAIRAIEGDRRSLLWLAGVGAVAPWASHPAAFVLAGTGLVLAWRPLRDRDWPAVRTLAALGVLWAASLGLEYVVSLRELSGDDALQLYWRDGFVPRPFDVERSVRWLQTASSRFAGDPAGFRFGALALLVAAVGAVLVVRRRPVAGWLVLAPLPFLLLAAALELFPFQGRVALFLVPAMLLLVTAPLAARAWPATAGVVGLVAIAPVVTTLDRVADPLPYPETRAVLEHVRDHRQPDDELWLMAPATPPFQYYATKVGLRADRQLDWLPDDAACRATTAPVPARVSGRVWVVHAYTYDGRPGETGVRVRSHLDAVARRIDTYRRVDASATLYDFTAPPTGGDADPVPGRWCLEDDSAPVVTPTGLHTGPFGTGRTT